LNFKIMLFLTILCSDILKASTISDRVIMVINTQPVTQWQVESYINLRMAFYAKDVSVSPISEVNWSQALDTYVRDHVVLQESTKQLGFRPSKDLIKSSLSLFDANLKASTNLSKRLVDLQVTQEDIYSMVVKQLTISGFKKTRERMGINTKNTNRADAKNATSARFADGKEPLNDWENDLLRQAVVRWYDDGTIYKN
jgi:hypothetical protein